MPNEANLEGHNYTMKNDGYENLESMTEEEYKAYNAKTTAAFNDPEQERLSKLIGLLASCANVLEATAYAFQNVPRDLHITGETDIRDYYRCGAGRDLLDAMALMWRGGPEEMRREIDNLTERLEKAGVLDSSWRRVNTGFYHLLDDDERWDEKGRDIAPKLDYEWDSESFRNCVITYEKRKI